MSNEHFRNEGLFVLVHNDEFADDVSNATYIRFCFKCAGFDTKKKRFLTRADYIRQGLDFGEDIPNGIIADYLASMGRYKDEAYMRGLGE